MQCTAVHYSSVQCIVVQYRVVCSAGLGREVRWIVVQGNAVYCSAVQCSVVQRSAVQ